MSLCQICLDLNRRGMTGCDGGVSQSGNVGKMLANRAYLGEYRIQPGKGKFSKMEAEVFIANAHPALVTKEIFDRVQRKLAHRRTTRTKPRRSWTLVGGGLGLCGHCGGLLKCHSHYKTKGDERGRPHTYHCGRHANGFPCPSGQVSADDLHRLMIEAYKEAWLSDEGQRILRERLTAKITQRKKPAAGDEKPASPDRGAGEEDRQGCRAAHHGRRCRRARGVQAAGRLASGAGHPSRRRWEVSRAVPRASCPGRQSRLSRVP